MKWPGELARLKPVVNKILLKYWCESLLGIISGVLLLNILFTFISLFLVALPLGVIYLGNFTLILYLGYHFYKRRPKVSEIATFLDGKLGSKERILTYLEFTEKPDSQRNPLFWEMKREVEEFVKRSPLQINLDMKGIAKKGLVSLLLTVIFLSLPLLSEGIDRDSFFEDKKKEVIEEIEEDLQYLIELDEEIYKDLIEELELIKELMENSKNMEELELLMREWQELLLEKMEELKEGLDVIDRLEELLDQPNPNNNLEEIMERIESLKNLPLDQETLERISDLMEKKDWEALGDLLDDLKGKLSLKPLEELLGEIDGGSDGNGNNGNNGNDGNNGSNGNNGNNGDNGNDGDNGSNGGDGHSPTGEDGKKEHEFTYIPKDAQLILEGAGEDGYTLEEILKLNPEITNIPYNDIYREYYTQGMTSIRRGEIPKPLEDYIRQYFKAIAP
ncbi:hypothetical protein [Anaerobranca gottschalkii]|uniref:Uncharacterized protein n=1 Tax=Anaerobranca gottschalkii DSM 13577 TaxID=1120990 RepID=A0A1H9Y3B4_9FIRM|nr:hypothetical protein [Anaerobranca gottschalkii]SES63293.1 hypothetical protein SAMN03080614_1001133 [Anaerobranca gottschalkii DSM 13577]